MSATCLFPMRLQPRPMYRIKRADRESTSYLIMLARRVQTQDFRRMGRQREFFSSSSTNHPPCLIAPLCFVLSSAVRRHPSAHRGQVRPRRRRKDPHLGPLQPQPAEQGKRHPTLGNRLRNVGYRSGEFCDYELTEYTCARQQQQQPNLSPDPLSLHVNLVIDLTPRTEW